jgi:hypothetical protein
MRLLCSAQFQSEYLKGLDLQHSLTNCMGPVGTAEFQKSELAWAHGDHMVHPHFTTGKPKARGER